VILIYDQNSLDIFFAEVILKFINMIREYLNKIECWHRSVAVPSNK